MPAGQHSIEWTYDKDISQFEGSDLAIIDNVQITNYSLAKMPMLSEDIAPEGTVLWSERGSVQK